MGTNSSKDSDKIEDQYDLISNQKSEMFGDYKLLKSKASKEMVVLQELTFGNETDMKTYAYELETYQKLTNPNLLGLIGN